jgi:transcriptional regulator with XRE-family HTH domain
MTMEHKPLFGDLIAAHDGLPDALKAVDIAADLTLLLNHAGMSRADLARALGWSRARVTQVLSGHENLTVQTISAVTQALGYTFDAVFRKTGAPAPAQPWDAQGSSAPDMVNTLTSRSGHGPLMLPSLSFQDLSLASPVKAANRKKSAAPSN